MTVWTDHERAALITLDMRAVLPQGPHPQIDDQSRAVQLALAARAGNDVDLRLWIHDDLQVSDLRPSQPCRTDEPLSSNRSESTLITPGKTLT